MWRWGGVGFQKAGGVGGFAVSISQSHVCCDSVLSLESAEGALPIIHILILTGFLPPPPILILQVAPCSTAQRVQRYATYSLCHLQNTWAKYVICAMLCYVPIIVHTYFELVAWLGKISSRSWIEKCDAPHYKQLLNRVCICVVRNEKKAASSDRGMRLKLYILYYLDFLF